MARKRDRKSAYLIATKEPPDPVAQAGSDALSLARALDCPYQPIIVLRLALWLENRIRQHVLLHDLVLLQLLQQTQTLLGKVELVVCQTLCAWQWRRQWVTRLLRMHLFRMHCCL